MTPPYIRQGSSADIPELHRLIEGAYRGDRARQGWTHESDLLDGQRIDPEGLRDILADPRRVLLIAERSGAMAGCVRVADLGGGRAELGLLAVEPTMQAGGLGRQLMDAAERHARSSWAARVMEMTVIEGREELIAWYGRRGYALTGERRPFPMEDPRFGLPRRPLAFVVLAKTLALDTMG